MAISLLGRTLIARPKPNLLPSFLPRTKFFSSSSSGRLVGVGVPFRPLAALTELPRAPRLAQRSRCFSTNRTASSLSDPSPNWNNRPPKETILLDGCDFEHWLIVLEKPEEGKTRDEIIDTYIKTAASVIGSEEEARKKIYSVSTRHYFAFGVIVSEEDSYKFKELPGVRWVLPDSYLDVRNKDYGGEPFINGEAVPYDPKYHEEWVRNNAKANERSRRNDRPRNIDRPRNFERRENMQNRGIQGPQGNHGPPGPAPNMQPPMPNTGGMPPNANTQNSMSNMGGLPPHANVPPNTNVPNYGAPNANMQNNAPNYANVPPNPNTQNYMPNRGSFPTRDAGPNTGFSNNVPSYESMPPKDAVPNAGYSNPNMGGVPNVGNRDHQYRDATYSGSPRDSQNNYNPNMPSGNAYQVRDIP